MDDRDQQTNHDARGCHHHPSKTTFKSRVDSQLSRVELLARFNSLEDGNSSISKNVAFRIVLDLVTISLLCRCNGTYTYYLNIDITTLLLNITDEFFEGYTPLHSELARNGLLPSEVLQSCRSNNSSKHDHSKILRGSAIFHGAIFHSAVFHDTIRRKAIRSK
jgi:hypothetical protein